MLTWLLPSLSDVFVTIATAVIIMFAVVFIARLAGLRTFAKMSAFDFASTVAVGSIMASTVMNVDTSLLRGSIAIATIVGVQLIVGRLKFSSDRIEDVLENDPVLLMRNGRIMDDNLREAGVTRSDLIAKLREANVLQLSEVKAVVLETTGDVSVLHGSGDTTVDDLLLDGVRR